MHKHLAHVIEQLKAGTPLVLCTVVRALGSTPREMGARLLLSPNEQWLTIGGGRLEWEVAAFARQCLHTPPPLDWIVQRYPLGPSLGQCCGGVVEILYECLGPQDIAVFEHMLSQYQQQQAVQRQVRLETQQQRKLLCTPAQQASHSFESIEQGWVWHDILRPTSMHIYLFGAGHVGTAFIHILGTLDCRVHWIDERADLFPAQLPDNVSVEITDIPEALIEQAPANSYFLIMTHNHDVDLHLCEHILRHSQAAYLGLIGSRTKRERFIKRLRQKGFSSEQIDTLICPMGISGITGKAPAVIAVAVIAEILQHAQMQALSQPMLPEVAHTIEGTTLTHV